MLAGQVVLEIQRSSAAHVLHAQLAHGRAAVQRPAGGVRLQPEEMPRAVQGCVWVAQQLLRSWQEVVLFREERTLGDQGVLGGGGEGRGGHHAWIPRCLWV